MEPGRRVGIASLMGTLTDRLPGIGPLAEMLRPPPGLEVDFARPAAAPALVPAESVSWRIFDNPVTLFVGGVAAVILELAEPSVRVGVWDHSSFRRDPLGRLRRTGMAAMITVYAPRPAAEAMIARVVAMHDKVRGELPDGTPYHANDPILLDWVQATASFGFIAAYHAYAKPLSAMERDAAFAEGAVAARLYGAHGGRRARQHGKRCSIVRCRGCTRPTRSTNFSTSCAARRSSQRRCVRFSGCWCGPRSRSCRTGCARGWGSTGAERVRPNGRR